MQSPPLFRARINSEGEDPFSAAHEYYGEDSGAKHRDEHRTHTSVREYLLLHLTLAGMLTCGPSFMKPVALHSFDA